MKKLLAAISGAVVLAAGPAAVGAEPTDDADVVVVVQNDPRGDVKVKQWGRKSEKAPRRLKQSVDVRRVSYRVDRTLETPSLTVTYKVRNVLPDGHPRTQRFWTQVDNFRYYFTYFWSDGAGNVTVRYSDRGGDVKVRCPAATVQLFPGKANDRVVQTVPLSCIESDGLGTGFTSKASVRPLSRTRFVASDKTNRTSSVDLREFFPYPAR